MTAVVLNAAGLYPQNTAMPVNNSENSTEKADFASLMRGKISSDPDKSARLTDGELTVKKNTEAEKTVTPVSDGKSKVVKGNVSDTTETEQVSGTSEGLEEDENLNAQEAAAVLSVLNSIFTGITEILEISPEELNEAMNALTMTPADLTDRNSLAQLVLYVNGSDNMADMLIDNGMLETFNELTGFVAETISENQMTENSFTQLLLQGNDEELMTQPAVQEAIGKLPEEFQKYFESEKQPTQTMTTDVQPEEAVQEPLITVTRRDNAEQGQNGEQMSEEMPEAKTESVRTEKTEAPSEAGVISADDFSARLNRVFEENGVEETEQTDFREIVRQIVDQVKVDISPEHTSLEMKLNPDNLGRVSINIVSKNGVMTAEIHTENQTAREAIESQLQILKDNIEQKGIRVEEIEVRISDFHFADSRNAEGDEGTNENRGNGRQRRTGLAGMSDGDITAEETLTAREIMESAETTVNYRV